MDYITNFRLSSEVSDLEAARDFLAKDDMTKYFKGDSRVSEQLANKVDRIYWRLQTTDSGIIKVTTNSELTANESKLISDWILGQNSDGIGESFSQQEFAETHNYNEFDDDGDLEDDYIECASFDWTTNNYELTRIVEDF